MLGTEARVFVIAPTVSTASCDPIHCWDWDRGYNMGRRDGQDKNFLNLTWSSFLPHCELMAAHQNITSHHDQWLCQYLGNIWWPGSVGSRHIVRAQYLTPEGPQYSYTVQSTHSIEIERFYQNWLENVTPSWAWVLSFFDRWIYITLANYFGI